MLKDNPDKFEATAGNLLPIMVKAIQELKAENDALKDRNEKLAADIESLKSMNEKIAKLEKMINDISLEKSATITVSAPKIVE